MRRALLIVGALVCVAAAVIAFKLGSGGRCDDRSAQPDVPKCGDK